MQSQTLGTTLVELHTVHEQEETTQLRDKVEISPRSKLEIDSLSPVPQHTATQIPAMRKKLQCAKWTTMQTHVALA